MLEGKVRTLLNQLVAVPFGERDVIAELKHLPRTGKACRIDNYQLKLPKRSLYDHVLSLAVQADILAPYAPFRGDTDALARAICFHDLPEVLTGDVPDFTSQKLAKTSYKSPERKAADERRAVKLIAQMLPGSLAKDYRNTQMWLADRNDDTHYFRMLDKTDPILGVWRYLYSYGKDIAPTAFCEAMHDFFTNPAIATYCAGEVKKLITFLQNVEHAKEYHRYGISVLENYPGQLFLGDLKRLVERELYTVPSANHAAELRAASIRTTPE
ncbi:MAG TPA: HD domain-containing protein [Candidatus Binatia bacterium]|nr:HD domain-containing protein [Candidatus Binatia bacterium]